MHRLNYSYHHETTSSALQPKSKMRNHESITSHQRHVEEEADTQPPAKRARVEGGEEEGADVPTAMGTLDALPLEVLVHIMSFVDAAELVQVALINRTFRGLADHDIMWRPHCLRSRTVSVHLPVLSLVFQGGKSEDQIKWKHMYRHLVRRCVCKRCGWGFRPVANSEQACAFHDGRWKPSLSAEGDRWTCCHSPLKQSPGCVRAWHEDVCAWNGLF